MSPPGRPKGEFRSAQREGTSMSDPEFVTIDWQGRKVRIEHQWIAPGLVNRPLVVFLHEGLGSVSMWKDFPRQLCHAAGLRGLVYSRPGYGRSTPREPDERWAVDYMHRQAYEVLPKLLDALRVDAKPWLFGHSDGGSIGLLYASRFPASVAGLVVLAPHILVEEYGLESIRKARDAYPTTDLRQKLSRYHEDVDSAFWGWNHIWLDPAFKAWNIERELSSITCPVLAVQGLDDEYGTLEQIKGIARRVPQTRLLELADCRHSPHRDQPAPLIDAAGRFIAKPHGDKP
jgi:pimeloyl-ACP methyl ester carboxylesterase